jgi:hypothetical protein
MTKQITFALLLFSSIGAFAQLTQEELETRIKPLTEKVGALQKENAYRKSETGMLSDKLESANDTIENLKQKIQNNSMAISQAEKQLGNQIREFGDKNEGKITEVSESLSKNSLYGIIGFLLAILLTGLFYWLLSKRQKTDKTELDGKLENKTSILKSDVITEIERTKKELQQENIKLDLKLIEVLESQLNRNKNTNEVNNSDGNITIDHSIPLKVADEITRINAYANTLDPNSQDAKALKSSVKRLINTFKASQYEIIDLLGQKYDDGMKISVISYIPDEKIKKGEEVISRIIKPLVKYKGEQIQAAQVDVSIAI